MQLQELEARIAAADVPPVVVFAPGKAAFGREPFEPLLAERAAEAITRACLDPDLRDMAYTVYYADETPPAEIVQEAQTLAFLSPRRVILVRNAARYGAMSGEKGSPLLPLLEYIEQPNDTTILMLIAGDLDRRKRFFKVCEKAGVIVECPQLDDRQLAAWLREEAHRLGKKIAPAAAEELIERAGTRLGDVSNALNLVANFVGPAELIRPEDVVAACADVAEDTVWMLTDAIAASNMGRALELLHDLLGMGKAPDELIGTINWLLESAYRAAPNTKAQLKSAYQAKKLQPLVDKLGADKLRAALKVCNDTHFQMRSTGTDRELALEVLVMKLAMPRPKAAQRR